MFDRFGFPEGIERVTAGRGGESILIARSEKTALWDCGMAYCGKELTENIEGKLKGRALDYMLLSHTHYDHVGALPFVKRRWPGVVTVGSRHAYNVLAREGAINIIKGLGETARDMYAPGKELILPDTGFSVDSVVEDGDIINMGDEEIEVLATKGHTDCSVTFVLNPSGIMFLSESTGVPEGLERVHISILKSYKDTILSVEKCRNYGAKILIAPHFGIMPESHNERYWEMFLSTVEDYKEFLFGEFEKGTSDEEILILYEKLRRSPVAKKEQPKAAFLLNAQNVIKVFKKEYESELS